MKRRDDSNRAKSHGLSLDQKPGSCSRSMALALFVVFGCAALPCAQLGARPQAAGQSAPTSTAQTVKTPASQNSLATGTVLYVRLDTPVSSVSSKPHQKVKAHVVRQLLAGGNIVVPLGAEIDGEIESIHKSENPGDPALLSIHFTQLILPGMKPANISCHLSKIENSREMIRQDGTIQGVLQTDLPSSYVDSGLGKLAKQLPGLSGEIESVQKKQVGSPDVSITYPAGTDMQLALDKPLPVEKTFPSAYLQEIPGADLNAVEQLLQTSPQRSSTQKGQPGDPINLVFIGGESEIQKAFQQAGWDVPAVKQNQTVWKTVQAVIQGQGYGTAPISNLYLFSRPQDLAFEKVLNTFAMRHHLRLWRSSVKTPDGREIWLGAAVHDTGFDVHPGVASHATDPHLDDERAKVGADLVDTTLVASTQLVTPPKPLSRGTTGTGGTWETDGKLLVIDLKP
ncbi:MAG TPA: LssY C-terminal domain-containing protein [Terriglobia bacterium]|nr:LssY C-terminal domain-containing protein [Terriglobia bacterium]